MKNEMRSEITYFFIIFLVELLFSCAVMDKMKNEMRSEISYLNSSTKKKKLFRFSVLCGCTDEWFCGTGN